jgi:hypothetical protein
MAADAIDTATIPVVTPITAVTSVSGEALVQGTRQAGSLSRNGRENLPAQILGKSMSRANSKEHADPVDCQPVRISIKTVQYEPAAGQNRLQVPLFYQFVYNLNLQIRVELRQAFWPPMGLGPAQIGRIEENPAVNELLLKICKK